MKKNTLISLVLMAVSSVVAADSSGTNKLKDAIIQIVTGPITGGQHGMAFNPVPAGILEQHGYSQQEYFIAGIATAYAFKERTGAEGKWSVTPTTSATYKTRMLVRRPVDSAKFNGTVVVEWLNVSAGQDSDPDWGFSHEEIMRSGGVWVGVSAQSAGVGNGAGMKLQFPGFNPQPLKKWDPERYDSLQHPGDQYSYDIFTQAGRALVRSTSVNPLGDLNPKIIIAIGESQSAGRMLTYVNAIHPVARVYDGFLIHSRGSSGASLNGDASGTVPKVSFIRDDLDAPVMQIETETDMFGLGFYPARQPDTKKLVTWEMAGTAHADQSAIDYGNQSYLVWSAIPSAMAQMRGINDGPQRYIVRSALSALNIWCRGGSAPVHGEPFTITNGAAIARDTNGNAEGGVRTPQIDVPTETLSGAAAQTMNMFSVMFGSATPFPPEKLAELYPNHQDYAAKVMAAARTSVAAGYLLPADQTEIVSHAQNAKIPN